VQGRVRGRVRGRGQSRGQSRGQGRAGGMPPAILLGHFGLAAAGLGLWIAFMASDVRALAWTAASLLLPTAGLGMATLVTALPEPAGPESAQSESAQPESAQPEPAGSDAVPPDAVPPDAVRSDAVPPEPMGPVRPDSGRLATRVAATAAPARVRMPVAVIALHGVLATATMLLVLLAAIGVP
ncbi:MAG: hypothetical protein ACRDRJ_41065, partial [Streptosporangiaceae bacterium]